MSREINILSKRQIEILELMSNSLSDKMIADELGISVHTVKATKRFTYLKLQVNNAPGAVAEAFRQKLIA